MSTPEKPLQRQTVTIEQAQDAENEQLYRDATVTVRGIIDTKVEKALAARAKTRRRSLGAAQAALERASVRSEVLAEERKRGWLKAREVEHRDHYADRGDE